MHHPQPSVDSSSISESEFPSFAWQQQGASHEAAPATKLATAHGIAREDSCTLGEVLSTPAIREPQSEHAPTAPEVALRPRPSVRKAKSFNALGIHQDSRASKSSPDLHHSNLSHEIIPPVPSTEELSLPPKRTRKTSALGLGLSWAGLGTSTDSTKKSQAAEGKPALSTRKSFSFLRPHARSVTAPPRTQAGNTTSHLSSGRTTSSVITTSSSEAATPPPVLPSLPSLDFNTGIDWDLHPHTSSPRSRSSSPKSPPSRPATLTRNRSSSLGKWSKSLKDAVTSSATTPPALHQVGRSRSGSTNSLKTSSERRASMRRSMSHQGSGIGPLPQPDLQPPQQAYMSMPSSPLAQSTDAFPSAALAQPEHPSRGSTLTFALPSPRHSSTEITRSSSANSDQAQHRPLQNRRNSVASAIHALNPFNHHHHNSSKQSLASSDVSGDERPSSSVVDSPSEEPDLHTLLARSHSPKTELGQLPLGGDRRRSGSVNTGSASSGFLNTVFGRRRGNSIPLHHLAPTSSVGADSLAVPPSDDARPSTSSAASFQSAQSDPSSAAYNRGPASASASTLPPSNTVSPVSSRKPSMIFSSSKTGTRSSFSSQPSPTFPPAMPVKEVKPPKAEESDTPESYLLRLEENCARTQIAKLLASSSDPFYAEALRLYVGRFQFKDIPVDIALRKLLMDLFLPKETQQIDRVMDTFAQQYQQQNPGIFATSDQCYVLAFSLIMLHTDAFNAQNKSKMTKEEYTRNTRIEGLPVELLDYCYDQIVHCPFVFSDGQMELGSHSSSHLGSALGSSLSSSKEKAKVEVYHLIQHGQTGPLRVGVHKSIPFKNPYSFTGTVPFFNSSELQDAFVRSHKLLLPNDKSRSTEALTLAAASQVSGVGGLQMAASPAFASVVNYAKAGVLLRKDDLEEGGKKASSRKWREWAVVLTTSQLLFFKDPQWMDILLSPSSIGPDGRCSGSLPPGRTFKPDAVLSLQGFVAIYDFSFTKRANTFMLVSPESGKQLLFQTTDNADLNEWIGLINWAASFQNTGVKLRTESTLDSARRRPRSSVESTARPSDSRRLVFSARGQVVGSTAGGDPDWDDDHVFEQFTQGDLSHISASKASRTDIVRNCIRELDQSISSDKTQLQRDIRQARILHSCQPFATSTRSRVASHVPPLARRIRQARLRICKSSVSREVLARDLLSEERDITRVLMQGAASTRPSLQSHRSDMTVPRSMLSESDGGAAMERSRTEEL